MHYPKPSTIKPKDIEYMIDEINALNKEAHQYLRLPHLILNLAFSALPLVIAQSWGGKPTDLSLLVAPLVFGILAMYNLNLAAEAAGLSEIRDRLANQVNKAIKQPIFLMRVLSDARRGSPGTVAAYGLAIVVILITMTYGLIHAKQVNQWWFLLQITVTFIPILATSIGVIELAHTRIKINDELDSIFGQSSRPTSAPSHADSWWKRILTALTKRVSD